MTISENTPPAGGRQRRKKPNENETGVTLRGREWKSAGRRRKAQKRVRGAPKRKLKLIYIENPLKLRLNSIPVETNNLISEELDSNNKKNRVKYNLWPESLVNEPVEDAVVLVE
ncbi:hypothetical protein TNCV_425791 [Trichonephila clavipes]|nr:hypothetical protein TNCV_425791 [Trichonephila clavipes]